MRPAEAIVKVLSAAGEPLHWTVIQDRALREGYLDPFVIPDVRGEVLGALRGLVACGDVRRVDKGTYEFSRSSAEPGSEPTQR